MREARIEVHEHERLVIGQSCRSPDGPEVTFTREHWDALAAYADRTGSPALVVGRDRITFGHHVGYLQVGRLRIEVLPKPSASMEGPWRDLLRHMLREVLGVRIAAQDAAPLRARTGDLYRLLVLRFTSLVEGLLREGLARAYREVEGNETALRGRLVVERHVRANAAHQERLYVAHSVLDADILPNRALLRALERVRASTTDASLVRSAEALLGELPELSPEAVRPSDLDRIRLDRRTMRYREALGLARLILAGERPDLRWGGSPVVALLFDMNALFEAYVERQLRRLPGVTVRSQAGRVFWQAMDGGTRLARPDLVVRMVGMDGPLVIDTKWKVPRDGRPSDEDLRQLFAYLRVFGARRGLLVYPRATVDQRDGMGRFSVDDVEGGVALVDLLPGGRPDAVRFRAQLHAAIRTPASPGALPAGGVTRPRAGPARR